MGIRKRSVRKITLAVTIHKTELGLDAAVKMAREALYERFRDTVAESVTVAPRVLVEETHYGEEDK